MKKKIPLLVSIVLMISLAGSSAVSLYKVDGLLAVHSQTGVRGQAGESRGGRGVFGSGSNAIEKENK
jgi:hypothetical protein